PGEGPRRGRRGGRRARGGRGQSTAAHAGGRATPPRAPGAHGPAGEPGRLLRLRRGMALDDGHRLRALGSRVDRGRAPAERAAPGRGVRPGARPARAARPAPRGGAGRGVVLSEARPARVLEADLTWTGDGFEPDVRVVVGEDGSILAVERGSGDHVPAAAPTPLERLSGRALLPGFVNAHSHAFQRGLRGHGET